MKHLNLKRSLGLWMLCCLLPLAAMAQEFAVKGTVTDQSGQPIVGASVVVKSTVKGTTTDLDGSYQLMATSKDVLVFSFLGYIDQEVTVNGKTQINVTLAEDAQTVDEVVVIGYGTARRSDVTGSIATVGGEDLRKVPATDITQALQGRIAGVDMTSTSSKPGASMQIRIRGERSLSASNDPLIVLDGIPFMGSISDINPSDIKSMDILKDAASTAIYGSRGANGVIMITTFKGTRNQPARVTYSGYVGIKDAIPYDMMQGEEYVKMREYAGMYTNSIDESNDVNTDWQDMLYRTGIVTNHSLNVSAGTDHGSYSFGAGYYLDQAVLPTQDYSRYSLNGSIDQQLGKYIRVGITTNTSYSQNHGNQVNLYSALSKSPLIDPYNEDGTMKERVNMPLDTDQYIITKDVLEKYEDLWLNESQSLATYNTAYAEVQIPGVEGLSYRVNLGLNYRSKKQGTFTGMGINDTNPKNPNSASLQHDETTNWVVENIVTFDRTFADKHRVNVVGMYSAEETKFTKSHVAGKEIPAEYFQYYNIGQAAGEITVDPSKWDYQKSGLMSWMARAMYSYDNRYMLSVAVRSDGSSRLAKGNQWHTYPAVSAGWNVHNEQFMKNTSWLDMLKVRVGYGETSNQAIAPYKTLGLLSTRPYNFGSDYATGYYVSQLPNNELGWEYTETWNFGVDFSLWGGRLTGTMEYYMQDTKDILLGVGLPATSGVSSYTANIGATQNRGFELTLNGTILKKGDWTWDAGVNLYMNRNELVELASGQERDESNCWFVGHPIRSIFDYERIGLWQEGDPYLDILEPGGNVGMIKVKYTGDYNADGTPTRAIGAADRQIIDVEPDFMGGFNTRVAWKGLDLTVIGSFQAGGTLISSLHSSNSYLNMLTGRRGQIDVDYWTPENTGARYPKPGGITSNDNPKYGSTLGYFDASYVKIRTITLGYTMDHLSGLKKIGIEGLRVYVTVQNPFVIYSPFHRESGLDPETNTMGDDGSTSAVKYSGGMGRMPVVGYNTPNTRNYLLGVNLTF
ncbi:MAG: TonB-dependent receptor [Rikenellaceae bacterium]|nr:TonB-dependent receptor [Rikenellaceae bacterium]